MAKIAMIGAGSVVFAKRLMTDILTWPELQDSTISLMDINAERVEAVGALARRLVAQEKFPAKIETTTDRRQALDGADYVVIMIMVGGLDVSRPDIDIPLRYGVDQTVGDTLGPGGVIRFLRTIPALLEICHDMEELCPNALLINYSNPMAMNIWAMNRGSFVDTVGLCHSVQGTAMRLAEYVGEPFERVRYWVAGINHQAWFLRFERDDRVDLYPRLWEKLEDPETFAKDKVRFEIMRHFGFFVTESTRHMSEYVPYFRRTREMAEEWAPPSGKTFDAIHARQQEHYKLIHDQIDGVAPIEVERTHEYCSHIIHAMETNTPHIINGNVMNTGLIPNLPRDCVVEAPCLVDGLGIHPCHVGEIPPQLAALNRTNINVQDLAVRGAIEHDRDAIYQAIQLDPLTASKLTLSEAHTMTDELLEASKAYLDL